jgi:hypothetical protein
MGVMRMAGSIFKFRPKSQREIWQEFFDDTKLLARHHVTDEELVILHDFSPLGAITCIGDVLFILSTIRWANRQGS